MKYSITWNEYDGTRMSDVCDNYDEALLLCSQIVGCGGVVINIL